MSTARERLRELAARAGLREAPGSVLAAALVVCVALVVWAVTRGAPTVGETFPADPPETSETAELQSGEPTCVVVHVAGCVRRPGVYVLDAGSRVGDAVEAAGGGLGAAELDALNLARVLRDGEQVRVPLQGETAGAGGDEGAPAGAGALVDLNSASQAELEGLPGVGPSTAAKIVQDREKNGPFGSPEDLMRVPGIGPKKFESLKDMVTAG